MSDLIIGNLTLAPATFVFAAAAVLMAVLLIVALAAWRRAAGRAGDETVRAEAAS